MKQADIDFLTETQRLGDLGLDQDDIAAAMGITPRRWRYRLETLGFGPSAETRIRCRRTGKSLAEMLASGEIQPMDAPAEAAVPA